VVGAAAAAQEVVVVVANQCVGEIRADQTVDVDVDIVGRIVGVLRWIEQIGRDAGVGRPARITILAGVEISREVERARRTGRPAVERVATAPPSRVLVLASPRKMSAELVPRRLSIEL